MKTKTSKERILGGFYFENFQIQKMKLKFKTERNQDLREVKRVFIETPNKHYRVAINKNGDLEINIDDLSDQYPKIEIISNAKIRIK